MKYYTDAHIRRVMRIKRFVLEYRTVHATAVYTDRRLRAIDMRSINEHRSLVLRRKTTIIAIRRESNDVQKESYAIFF